MGCVVCEINVMRVGRHAIYYWPLSVTAGGDPLIGRNVAEGVPAPGQPDPEAKEAELLFFD